MPGAEIIKDIGEVHLLKHPNGTVDVAHFILQTGQTKSGHIVPEIFLDGRSDVS